MASSIRNIANLRADFEYNRNQIDDGFGGWTQVWEKFARNIRCSIQAQRAKEEEEVARQEMVVSHRLYADWNQGYPKTVSDVLRAFRSEDDTGEFRVTWLDGTETRIFEIMAGYDAASRRTMIVFELSEQVSGLVRTD